MASPSSRIRQLLFAAVMLVTFVWGGIFWMNRVSDPIDLNAVRTEARAMFAVTDLSERRLHAHACAAKAELLLGEPGVLDCTARLYLLAVSPISGTDVSQISVPDAKFVREMQTEDLLLITRLMLKTKRLGPADQLLDLLLSREDADRSTVLELAVEVRSELGRDEDVLSHAEELIALHPEDPKPHRFQGIVHRTRGHWDHFVDAMERALELSQVDDPVLKIELADGYIQLGRTEDGRRLVDEIAAEHPNLLAQAPIMRSRLLMQEGKIEKSEKLIDDFLARVPDDAEALIVKGTLLLNQERFEEAIEVLDRAIASSPSEELAYYQMGQAYARLGKQELAKAFLNQHREILDTKVRLFELEHQAALEPLNVAVRQEIAELYAKIGLQDLSEFWRRAANAASD